METTRRKFLSLLALGATAAVAAPELLKAAPKPYASGGFVPNASLGLIGEKSVELCVPRSIFPGDFVTRGLKGKLIHLHDGPSADGIVGIVREVVWDTEGRALAKVDMPTRLSDIYDWDAES